MLALIKSSIGTKFVVRWADLMCRLALDAVRTVSAEDAGVRTVDIKRYARVEKVPGGEIESSRVLSGVMLNKDIVHPQMRRRIHNPRIILLDCPLEYKKGESQTNIEISKEADFARINQIEEEQVKAMVDRILEFNPDLVITEKGISGASFSSLPGLLLLIAPPRHVEQIMRSTSSPRRTSPRSDAYASQTTTGSRGQ
jgi:T-complex protein 1 subunit gamma